MAMSGICPECGTLIDQKLLQNEDIENPDVSWHVGCLARRFICRDRKGPVFMGRPYGRGSDCKRDWYYFVSIAEPSSSPMHSARYWVKSASSSGVLGE
jgi:hypothetical protein